MADTPYREPHELDVPRPPRRDPLADETENPPHVRVAGALLAANALLGVALGAAQARAGLPANMGILVFAALLDVPIGFGLWKRAPRLVRPTGLRRFAAFRLVCGMGVALLSVRASPPATVLSLCASLACLVLLTREVTRTRAALSALAQALVVLASVWLFVWSERGERLLWGPYLHARGEVGASAAGRVGGGARPYALEVPPGWYFQPEDGAASDLHLVEPAWDARLEVATSELAWDDGPIDAATLETRWLDALRQGGARPRGPERIEVPGAHAALRVRIPSGRSGGWGYIVHWRDGDTLVKVSFVGSYAFVAAHGDELHAMLRSLRANGRSASDLARGAEPPIAAVPSGRLPLNAPGWSVSVPGGWWALRPTQNERAFGAGSEMRGLTAPFETTVVGFQVAPEVDRASMSEWLQSAPGVSHVTIEEVPGLADATAYVAHDADGAVVLRALAVPRGGAFLLAQALGPWMPDRRWAEFVDMLRGATFPAQP